MFFYQIIFCVDLNFFLFLAVNNVRTLSSYTILTSLTNNYKTITMHSTPLKKQRIFLIYDYVIVRKIIIV